MFSTPFSIQPYAPQDYARVLALMRHAARAHVHFDWQTPEECLEDPAVFACLGMHDDRLVAGMALSAPVEGVNWLRMLAIDHGVSVEPAVRRLWSCAEDRLRADGVVQVNVLHQERWLYHTFQPFGFVPVDQVVTLRRDAHTAPPLPAPQRNDLEIMVVRASDLEAVWNMDRAAFDPLWQFSWRELQAAWRLANLFVLALQDGQPAGYAIATLHHAGGHVARLAIAPSAQGQGIGRALLRHVLLYFEARQVPQVTVNTQASNLASQQLYTRFGFVHTGYDLPVLALTLD